MKKVILIMIVIIWTQVLFCISVQMSDGLKYEGIFSAKQKGNIYLLEGNMLYELPLEKIVKIENNGANLTDAIFNMEDFSDISIDDIKFSLYTHGSTENQKNDNANSKDVLLNMSDQKIDYANSKELLLNMSDREFEIYKLNQQQKQAELVASNLDRINVSMWSIWGVSLGISIVVVILENQ